MWNGFDEMLLSGLAAERTGAWAAPTIACSRLVRGVYDRFRAGDPARALAFQRRANEAIEVICRHGVFASVKKLLEYSGIESHGCRRPFSPLSPEGEAELRRVYETHLAR